MKNITPCRLWTVLLPLLLGFAAVTTAFAQPAIPTLGVPDARISAMCNWQGYWSRFGSAFAKKVGFPKGVTTIYVVFNPSPGMNWWMSNGVDTIFVPQNFQGCNDGSMDDFGVPIAVVRELANIKQNGGANGTAITEGFDNAALGLVYTEVVSQGYSLPIESGLSSMRMANGLPRDCKAGNNVFLSLTESQNDPKTVGGWLTLMTGGNLVPLANALEDLGTQILAGKAATDGSAALALLDQILPPLEGKSPSTVYRDILSTFLYGPDGPGFCAQPASFISATLNDYAPIIRKGDLVAWTIRTRANGVITNQYPPASVQVLDETGQVVMTQFGGNGSTFFPTSAPANGAYVVRAMACPTAAPCDQTNALYTHDLPWFADDNWQQAGVFSLICNGDGTPGSFSVIGKKTCRLVNPPTGVTSTTFGSYTRTNLNGYSGPLTFNDGSRNVTFQVTAGQTQVAYWTLLDQPYVYGWGLIDGRNGVPQVAVPGSWVSVFGYFMSHDDPTAATTTTHPPTFQGAGVKVTDINGITRDAPVIFTSPTQANFQLPWNTVVGPIGVQTTLNGTVSNMVIGQAVSANPTVFAEAVSGGSTIGAVTFAAEADPRYGQLVTPANPVGKTDWVSLWLNGLGGMNPEPADAKVTPHATAATAPVSVTIGTSQCQVAYAGLAPGFVSLGQVNIDLSTCVGLTGGNWPLVITVGGISSQPIELAVK